MNRAFYTALIFAASALLPLGGRAAEDNLAKGKDATSPTPNELRFAPSGFVHYDAGDQLRIGKDVFFPHSVRLQAKLEAKAAAAGSGPDVGPLLSKLVLKGISGNSNRRLAVVNNRTLAQGETFELKNNGQNHRIKCEEIKTRSVVLSVEGFTEKKELQLRDGL